MQLYTQELGFDTYFLHSLASSLCPRSKKQQALLLRIPNHISHNILSWPSLLGRLPDMDFIFAADRQEKHSIYLCTILVCFDDLTA